MAEPGGWLVVYCISNLPWRGSIVSNIVAVAVHAAFFITQGRNRRNRKKSGRSKSKSGSVKENAAVVAIDTPPVADGGALPNPRLDIKQYSECSHGCKLAAPGTTAHKLLYYCLAGLNAGVDGFPNHCNDSTELKVRSP